MISHALLPQNLHLARSVKALNLVPQQQDSARKLLRSADCYQQKFIKFPHIGIFHSYAEFIHAALLESDPEVSMFVPQPFLLHIRNRRYIPDCYFVKSGQRIVLELKPRGDFKDELKIPLEAFFEQEQMIFNVLSNEDVLEQETLALNWLKIIRILISAQNEDTSHEEFILLNRLFEIQELELGDIVFVGDRIGQRKTEIALFRLAHKGKLKLDIKDSQLGYFTKVTLCI
jgi:hypothetical protein